MRLRSEDRGESRYEGRFERAKDPRRLGGWLLALVILLLSLARTGEEVFKLLSYADVFIGGGKLLIYENVKTVELGPSIGGEDNPIPVYTGIPETDPTGEYIYKLDDGTTIVYQGHTYELNRNLATILFLGIDHAIEETDRIGTGGQSDVMLVIGLDTETGETTILTLSRDTYGQVDVYSLNGSFVETQFLQITLAYGYGNGKETSCENSMRTVSRLLYGLPIGSYIALDMDGILEANELIGGVTVPSLIDVTFADKTVAHVGDLIELHGKNLERYIRTRTREIDANTKRMERQKQYMTAFAEAAIARSREDLTFPVELFSALAPYMVTNLDISDVTFLSSTFLSHGASFSFRGVSGTYGKLDGSTVIYPDEVDLFEAVLQVFYKQVD